MAKPPQPLPPLRSFSAKHAIIGDDHPDDAALDLGHRQAGAAGDLIVVHTIDTGREKDLPIEVPKRGEGDLKRLLPGASGAFVGRKG